MKHYILNKTQLTSLMPPSSEPVHHTDTFCNSFVFLHTFQYYSLANYSLKLVRGWNSIFKWKFLYKKKSFFSYILLLLLLLLLLSPHFFLNNFLIFFFYINILSFSQIHTGIMYICIFYCGCFCLLLQMWLMLFSGRMNH